MLVVLFGADIGVSSESSDSSHSLRVSRLFAVCENQLPECLVPVCGRPLLYYQLQMLKASSLYDVLLFAHDWSVVKIKQSIETFLTEDPSLKIMNVKVHSVPLHYFAVETLLHLQPRPLSDFIILNWDVLLEPTLIATLIDSHRRRSAVITSLLYQHTTPSDLKTKGTAEAKAKAAPFSFDTLKFPYRSMVPVYKHYFALDGEKLLSALPFEAAEDEKNLKFRLSKAILHRHPHITICRGLSDCTFYICSADVITFIEENQNDFLLSGFVIYVCFVSDCME
jgi:hypothetical protein